MRVSEGHATAGTMLLWVVVVLLGVMVTCRFRLLWRAMSGAAARV